MRGSLYVHISAIPRLARRHLEAVETAVQRAPEADWNIARIDPGRVGLMLYEDFDAVAFPSLLHATSIDLATGEVRRTDYRATRNPPILHRKEETVATDDPRAARWRAMTDALVAIGLFADPLRIGRLQAWTALLRQEGLEVRGADVCATR